MQALLEVILPVFLVIGFGYLAHWRGWFSAAGVDGLMVFTQKFAIPCLLFVAIARLDLAQEFDWRLLLSFYAGALSGFLLGLFGARNLFGRSWEDAVAIGFACLFSNSVLLGLPITERAYGAEALSANFAIIAIHSPFCYGVGITAMEVVRARGQGAMRVAAKVLRAMFSNTLILGIAAGFAVNLSGLPLPGPVDDALDLMVRAALPAAQMARSMSPKLSAWSWTRSYLSPLAAHQSCQSASRSMSIPASATGNGLAGPVRAARKAEAGLRESPSAQVAPSQAGA